MTSMTDIFSADLQAVELDMPVLFIWRGQARLGQRAPITASFDMEDAGFGTRFDFEMVVRCNQFTRDAQPALKDTFTIEDQSKAGKPRTKYRIDQIEPSQDGVAWTWRCIQCPTEP